MGVRASYFSIEGAATDHNVFKRLSAVPHIAPASESLRSFAARLW